MQVLGRVLDRVAATALVCALSAGVAFAQNANDEGNAAGPTIEDLALGETVPEGEVAVGDYYTVEENGNWVVRCRKAASGQDPCEMYQLLSDSQGTPIAEVVLFELPEGRPASAGASVVVPLETSLQQQLLIRVDENPAKRYPFAFCDQIGCHARIGLTAEEVNAYRLGGEALVVIVPFVAPDQQVEVVMSLSGFTASYDKVGELNGT
ncbi:MAG: invasion associated locus B family protein [Roseobacter sp.]